MLTLFPITPANQRKNATARPYNYDEVKQTKAFSSSAPFAICWWKMKLWFHVTPQNNLLMSSERFCSSSVLKNCPSNKSLPLLLASLELPEATPKLETYYMMRGCGK